MYKKLLAMRSLPYLLVLNCMIICTMSCSKSKSPVEPDPISPPPTENKIETFDPKYNFTLKNLLSDKIFPFFSLLKLNNSDLIKNNKVLQAFSNEYALRLSKLIQSYQNSSTYNVEDLIIKPEELLTIKKELQTISKNGDFNNLIVQHIKPSGFFRQYSDMSNEAIIGFCWEDAAQGINKILQNYVLGEKMVNDDKDGPLYDAKDSEYKKKLLETVQTIVNNTQDELFFSKTLEIALQTLIINGRNEAGRFEPLVEGENKKAIEKITTTTWDKYPYSIIIVPGDSPNSPGDSEIISESAKKRVEMAVDQYKNGAAPFLLFSGANIYPNHTPYHEAIQMKKYAIEHFQIPENIIFVDPHARHTNTNLRNSSRIIFKYQIPTNKKALVVATPSHISSMVTESFRAQSIREIGYSPVLNTPVFNTNSLEIIPDIRSLHIKPMDFLDP